MKKFNIGSIIMLAATLAFIGCKSNDIENEEWWNATSMIRISIADNTVDTFYYCPAMVNTYSDAHYGKNILIFHRSGPRGESLDEYFVNENGILYECLCPTKYFKGSEGDWIKNPVWKSGKLETKESSDYLWKKDNEDKACLTHKSSDGSVIFVFERDKKTENNSK